MAELYYVAPLEWQCLQNPITTGDGKFYVKAPFAGEFLGNRSGPRISGCITSAGTGAGTATQVQIYNVTQGRDMFTTLPRYDVDDADANGRALVSGGVLCLQPTFNQNDVLRLDIDGIPGGANSSGLTFEQVCGFRRTV